MPCGGIYPLTEHWAGAYLRVGECGHGCFYCGKHEPLVTHFVEEWDAYIHKDCIDPFLLTREGKLVLEHGHEVVK